MSIDIDYARLSQAVKLELHRAEVMAKASIVSQLEEEIAQLKLEIHFAEWSGYTEDAGILLDELDAKLTELGELL